MAHVTTERLLPSPKVRPPPTKCWTETCVNKHVFHLSFCELLGRPEPLGRLAAEHTMWAVRSTLVCLFSGALGVN